MGVTVWMFMYLLRNQTGLNVGGEGVVNYGHPLTLMQISTDFKGTPEGTLRRWIARLRGKGYIRTEPHSNNGLTFWIAKGKSKTKVPRIRYEVALKPTKNSRAKMNGSSNNSRAELHLKEPSSRDNLHGSSSIGILQPTGTKGVAPVPEAPTPKDFTSKNLLYYNNAATPSFSLLGKEKSIPQEKPTPSAMQIEARRRILVKQAEQIKRNYPSSEREAPHCR